MTEYHRKQLRKIFSLFGFAFSYTSNHKFSYKLFVILGIFLNESFGKVNTYSRSIIEFSCHTYLTWKLDDSASGQVLQAS